MTKQIVLSKETEDTDLIVRRNDILAALEEVQASARTRTLDKGDVNDFYKAYTKLRRKARREGLPLTSIYVRMSGGGVPSSYRYGAETTRIEVNHGRLVVSRTQAPKGGGGKPNGTVTGGLRGEGNGGIREL